MKIIEIDERNTTHQHSIEPAYRVSIELEDDEVIITRKYFYYGYYEHSSDFDNFWYNHKNSSYSSVGNLCKASFITRKIDDTEYLKIKENELIESFYCGLIENEKDIKKELYKVIMDYNYRIKKCQDNIKNDFFIKLNRQKKLKKINEDIY